LKKLLIHCIVGNKVFFLKTLLCAKSDSKVESQQCAASSFIILPHQANTYTTKEILNQQMLFLATNFIYMAQERSKQPKLTKDPNDFYHGNAATSFPFQMAGLFVLQKSQQHQYIYLAFFFVVVDIYASQKKKISYFYTSFFFVAEHHFSLIWKKIQKGYIHCCIY
jgi:hypothetical protein